MGVVVVAGLTAVNGPVFMVTFRVFTGTLVLRGLLLRQRGGNVSGHLSFYSPVIKLATESM